MLKRLVCYTILGWFYCEGWALTTCIGPRGQQGRGPGCQDAVSKNGQPGVPRAASYQRTEDTSTLGNNPGQGCSVGKHPGGRAREWQRLADLTPPTAGCSTSCTQKKSRSAHRCHRPQLRGAGRHSPEMRLAMVLVGTNRVLSTPSTFAAFSCSSEKGRGG